MIVAQSYANVNLNFNFDLFIYFQYTIYVEYVSE